MDMVFDVMFKNERTAHVEVKGSQVVVESYSDNPFKSSTTSSTGGLILALKRAILLLAPKGGIASTFTGPL